MSARERAEMAASLLETYGLHNRARDVRALLSELDQLHAEYQQRYDWALHERDVMQERAERAEERAARLEEAIQTALALRSSVDDHLLIVNLQARGILAASSVAGSSADQGEK